MNWFKKKFQQLSAKLNADEKDFETSIKNIDEKKYSEKKLDNIEELKEISVGAITQSVRLLGFGKTVVSGLIFHSAFADNAAENVGLMSLMNDEDFIKRIKREFKAKGIKYKDDFSVSTEYESKRIDKFTKIISRIAVEVLTPNQTLKKQNAQIRATEGFTWESEYILEPTGKHYFIGRCKDPKIENGPKIHNDIAFIGIEEKNEEQYKINNYVSRSHAVIVFNETSGSYKLYRSRFLNNPSHKIKIYNTSLNDFNGVALQNANVPHVLRDGDSITFNDTIVLEFHLIQPNESFS
jgi:hypothetical protein